MQCSVFYSEKHRLPPNINISKISILTNNLGTLKWFVLVKIVRHMFVFRHVYITDRRSRVALNNSLSKILQNQLICWWDCVVMYAPSWFSFKNVLEWGPLLPSSLIIYSVSNSLPNPAFL